MPNRVVHFEIEASDPKRARKFYEEAFGWKMDEQGPDMGNYIVVTTGDMKEPGGINGGIYKTMNGKKDVNAYRCVIGVDDIHQAMEDVKAAGGKILDEKVTDIPKVGLFVPAEDSEGNKFSLLQPSPEMMP